MLKLKKQLLKHCQEVVANRKTTIAQALEGVQQAANQETKSSAGDKYETGRAMMHLEKEKLSGQMAEVLKMEQGLNLINPEKESEQAELGALIRTAQAAYYLSVSVGKLVVDGQTIFAVSPASPIGQALLGKQSGEDFSFSGRTLKIIELS